MNSTSYWPSYYGSGSYSYYDYGNSYYASYYPHNSSGMYPTYGPFGQMPRGAYPPVNAAEAPTEQQDDSNISQTLLWGGVITTLGLLSFIGWKCYQKRNAGDNVAPHRESLSGNINSRSNVVA